MPICFALEGDTLYTAVDHKPKRSRDLQRLENIAANPAVSLLVDHYDEDWAQLWWVRADGPAMLYTQACGSASTSTVPMQVLVCKRNPAATPRNRRSHHRGPIRRYLGGGTRGACENGSHTGRIWRGTSLVTR